MDRKELKRQAKDAMRQARPAPFWVSLALAGIMLVLELLSMSLSGELKAFRTMYSMALESGRMTFVAPVPASGLLGRLLGIALQVMSLELAVGFLLYALRVWRREKAGCGDLFDGFGVFFRSILIQLLPSIYVSLWSLIYALPATYLVLQTGQTWWMIVCLPLMIPSVMAMYAYRQATYIMLDNPGMNCFQCVALSREAMRGHRWELFVLDLSFLGWGVLCLVVPVAGLLLGVWVFIYMQVVMAGYYEGRIKDFMAEHAPQVDPGA